MTGTTLSISNETPKTLDQAGYEALAYTDLEGYVSDEYYSIHAIKPCPCGGTVLSVHWSVEHGDKDASKMMVDKICCDACKNTVSGEGDNKIARWNSQ